jgi:hypothetical protein
VKLISIVCFTRPCNLVLNKFWEINYELYRLTRIGKEKGIDLHILTDRTDLSADNLSTIMSSEEYQQVLIKDIQQGLKYKIIATPSYVIDGTLYTGIISPHVLQVLTQ